MQFRDHLAAVFTLQNRMDDYDDLGTAILDMGPDADPDAVIATAAANLIGEGDTEDMRRTLSRRNGAVSAVLSQPFGMAIVAEPEHPVDTEHEWTGAEMHQHAARHPHLRSAHAMGRYRVAYDALRQRVRTLKSE